MLDAVNALLQ